MKIGIIIRSTEGYENSNCKLIRPIYVYDTWTYISEVFIEVKRVKVCLFYH